MWIHTVNGFVSIVKHNKIPNCLLVRGRVKADLEAILGPDYEVTTEPGSDYTYRAIVDAEDVAVIIADAIMDIDYTSHFKDVTIRRAPKVEHGSRSRALYAIWNAMADLQGYRPYSRIPRNRETVVNRGRKGGHRAYQDDLFAEPEWHANPAAAPVRHYDWSTHPQSSTYAGPAGGNVSTATALDLARQIDPGANLVVDGDTPPEAIAALEQDAADEAMNEALEHALSAYDVTNWTEQDWAGYYAGELPDAPLPAGVEPWEPQEALAVAVALLDATVDDAKQETAANPVDTAADEEARADWESLQAQESQRRGPAGARRKPVNAAATRKAAPAKAAATTRKSRTAARKAGS